MDEYIKEKNGVIHNTTKSGLSFYKNGNLKEFNNFWLLLEIGVDINQIISPDLFHTLFSCLCETLHLLLIENLTTIEKNKCNKNMEKIKLIQKFEKISFFELGYMILMIGLFIH